MRQPKSLGGRLALFYVSALVVGLVIFAGLALVTIDRVQRASTDSALTSAAAAAATVVFPDANAGGLEVEEISAFRRVLGARVNGALFDARGRLKFSTTTDLPDSIATLGASENAFFETSKPTARNHARSSRAFHVVAGDSGRSFSGARLRTSATSIAASRSGLRLRSHSSRSRHSSSGAVSRVVRCSPFVHFRN